jgi:hypothetical protein
MLELRDKLDALKAVVHAGSAAAAIVAAVFCVAPFVWTAQHYGTVPASLTLAVAFILAAIAALLLNWIIRQRAKERQQRRVRNGRPTQQSSRPV